jgi:recombination protein RecR
LQQITFPSQLLEDAVEEFSQLPGIGKKTALRLVLSLLRQDVERVDAFSKAITRLRHDIQYCTVCHNISDLEVCGICSNAARDHSLLCVVENVKDVMAVENTTLFKGVYHVLGGVISLPEGIVPSDLEIDSLINRVKEVEVKDIILALPATMDGDTTNFYISRKLKGVDLKLSMLSRGVAKGDELEYTDEITLGHSIVNRTPVRFDT